MLAFDILSDSGFGLGPFGDPLGLPGSKYWASDLLVWSGYDGPQLILNWTAPRTAPGRLRILRKEREYPQSVIDPDAVLVYDEADPAGVMTTTFADTTLNPTKLGADPEAGTWYYYRVFTEITKDQKEFGDEDIGPACDPAGGSEGFDLAYSPDGFDDFWWDEIMPEVWRAQDLETSQRKPALYVDPTTAERVVLVNATDSEGFGERFIRVLALLLRRLFAYLAEIDRLWEVWDVRADELHHLHWTLQARINERLELNAWRRELQDAVYKHRLKGRFTWLEQLVEQEAGIQRPPRAFVEMHTRVLYAWNPQDPTDLASSSGLIWDALALVEQHDDPSTYGWCGALESPYNERGVRLYFDTVLTAIDQDRLMAEIHYAFPHTATVELWYSNRLGLLGWIFGWRDRFSQRRET